MKSPNTYKTLIIILLIVIVAQGIFILFMPRQGRLPKAAKPELAPAIKGRIAIVIDDWGYRLNNLGVAGRIKYPFTAAILPDLKYSKTVAGELHSLGKEIILHLPMQPNEELKLEKNTVLVSMNDEEIRSIVSEALAGLPYAKGVSNHMGSKATENPRVMSVIFGELKKRGLFFLDSLTSFRSVCPAAAKESKIQFARRDVFIDNEKNPAYIRKQLYRLASIAKSRGIAVGIGHDNKITLETLSEAMPELEKEGYKFVFLSEAVK